MFKVCKFFIGNVYQNKIKDCKCVWPFKLFSFRFLVFCSVIVGTRLAILEILYRSESLGLTGKEIQQKLAISRQLLSHHMSSLRNSNLVEKNGSSRKSPWKLSMDGLNELNGIQNKVDVS